MPFNAEPELADSSLFDALLRIAQNLVILLILAKIKLTLAS